MLRFYDRALPEVNELVWVEVSEVDEYSVTARLLQYGGITGLILASEVSRKTGRQGHALARVGKEMCAVVTRVDPATGYIDLSKRKASGPDAECCVQTYHRDKRVMNVLRLAAEHVQVDLADVLARTAWLQPMHQALDQVAALGTAAPLAHMQLGDLLDAALVRLACRYMRQEPVEMHAVFELSCCGPDGIEAVRETLLAAKRLPVAAGVSIRLVASPYYNVRGFVDARVLQEILDFIHGFITARCQAAICAARGGHFAVVLDPRPASKADIERLAEIQQQEGLQTGSAELGFDDSPEPDSDGADFDLH